MAAKIDGVAASVKARMDGLQHCILVPYLIATWAIAIGAVATEPTLRP